MFEQRIRWKEIWFQHRDSNRPNSSAFASNRFSPRPIDWRTWKNRKIDRQRGQRRIRTGENREKSRRTKRSLRWRPNGVVAETRTTIDIDWRADRGKRKIDDRTNSASNEIFRFDEKTKTFRERKIGDRRNFSDRTRTFECRKIQSRLNKRFDEQNSLIIHDEDRLIKITLN